MNRKHELEKYKGIKSRHTCPACGHKGVFSRYIDTETGEYLSDEVGRCNREDKCGYHYTPGQYFRDHPEEKTTTPQHHTPTIQTAPQPPRPIDTLPFEYVTRSLGYRSKFIRFLCSIFDPYTLESPTIEYLMKSYYLGCTRTGAVIYWQIDGQSRVRTGKIMQYDPETGKRIKNANGAIDWAHSKLKQSGKIPHTWELTQCLFGEHLLNDRPGDTVCLVESEKSALIAAGMMPQYLWLATGGKQNLKTDKCQCLKSRNVILYPDLGAFEDWKKKGKEIAGQIGFDIVVSNLLESIATPEDRTNGLDIADYIIRQLKAVREQENEHKTSVITLTEEEKTLQYLTMKNPDILTLISSLGLVSPSTGQPLRTTIN